MDITEYALPTARGLTCGDGQLVNFLRYVAVRVGRVEALGRTRRRQRGGIVGNLVPSDFLRGKPRQTPAR